MLSGDAARVSVALRVFWGIGILIERSVSLGSAHSSTHLTVGVLFRQLQHICKPPWSPPLPHFLFLQLLFSFSFTSRFGLKSTVSNSKQEFKHCDDPPEEALMLER